MTLPEVVVVRYGTRLTTRDHVFLNHLGAEAPDGPLRMDYFLWLIRAPDRMIVVDTGFATAVGRRRGRTLLVDPVEALVRLGAGPEDAPTVIVTHAHYDHIGNLAAFGASPVVVAEAELDFWSGPLSRRGDFAANSEPDELDALRRARAEGRTIEVVDRRIVAEGVEVVVVGGHTPGQMVVTVQTPSGPVVIASDALHYTEEIVMDRPFTVIADVPAAHRALDLLAARALEGARVLPGHDPDAVKGLAQHPDPNLPEHAVVLE